MQDQRYNELQQMLGANAEKGIDEGIKELILKDSNELEELMERERFEALQSEAGRRADIGANASPEMAGKIGRLSREDYERFGRHTNYTPPSPVNKKKRKAKAKAQKQSRKKNRKH